MRRLAAWLRRGSGPPEVLARCAEERDALAVLHRALTAPPDAAGPDPVEGIVFSMDRAMQLHALLSSYAEQVRNPAPLHLLYRASTPAHESAYDEVIARHAGLLGSTTREAHAGGFRAALLTILRTIGAPRMFFLVDDIVFVDAVDLAETASVPTNAYVVSLRLGLHLTSAYTRQGDQPLPPFSPELSPKAGLACWRWKDGTLDWAYPLSVDGHIFGTAEMRAMAEHLQFAGPNSFEAELDRLFGAWFRHRLGLCYPRTKLVNVPLNRVQEEIANSSAEIGSEELLSHWRAGLELDHAQLYGVMNRSVHQEFAPVYRRRTWAGAGT